jgi:hypothetical protein
MKGRCEVGSELCSGKGCGRFTGTRKCDPVFVACLPCWGYLRRLLGPTKVRQVPRV